MAARFESFGFRHLLAGVVGLALVVAAPCIRAEEAHTDLTAWVAELRAEALAAKIRPETFDAAFRDFRPLEDVIEKDRNQPEFKMTFDTYRTRVVSETRVRKGRQLMAEHAALLEEIGAKFGVQPRFIVALWGVESNFGERLGGYPVVTALATLAWDGRRGAFFRGELMHALRILDDGHIDAESMTGSWAGAMGQTQFMPSSFTSYAVDQDGDRRSDIWGSTPDALASAANYLTRNGWRDDRTWGREVRLPAGFDAALVGRNTRRSLARWQALGVRRADGGDLPSADLEASVVQPGGPESPAFLAYSNFGVLMTWNRSEFFAAAVGILSDRLDE